jgi:hypothetical protein
MWADRDRRSFTAFSDFLPASSRYRRGKPESNDVDIVFCPPEDGKDVGLLHDLYMRMGDLGGVLAVSAASRCLSLMFSQSLQVS